MLYRIALVAEICSAILCIHCIYGERVRPDIKTIVIFMSILAVSEAAFDLQISNGFTVVSYLLFGIYCLCRFKATIFQTIINILVYAILFVSIQFVCMFIVGLIVLRNEILRTFIVNLMVLGICMFVLPKCKLHQLCKAISKHRKFLSSVVAFMSIIIFAVLYQDKVHEKVKTEYFVLAVPAVLLLLAFAVKLDIAQHEFKNHMAAMLSAHYTYKTYEKLVSAQEEYFGKLNQENKHNDLLLVGDSILIGFLYGKIQEAEADGIDVECTVKAYIEGYAVPAHRLIEILGILFDNAVEALKELPDRNICVFVEETEDGYRFAVRNVFRYVTYGEMEKWFRLGMSDKGSGRGIGLYYAKKLCEEYKCRIGCRNVEAGGKNWIEFSLSIPKADSK